MRRTRTLKRAGRIRASPRTRARRDREQALLTEARRIVVDRASGICERCGCVPEWYNPAEVHHLVPRSQARHRAWVHHPINLALLCRACHSSVHERSVADWRAWLLRLDAVDTLPEALQATLCIRSGVSLCPPFGSFLAIIGLRVTRSAVNLSSQTASNITGLGITHRNERE